MSLYHERRTSDATLEWESLPEVGADHARGVFRSRSWQAILVALFLFSVGVGSLIWQALS